MCDFFENMRKLLWIYTQLVALLLIPIALIILYASSDLSLATPMFALEKAPLPEVPNPFSSSSQDLSMSSAPSDQFTAVTDSLASDPASADTFAVDTTRRRLLLIGDSMVEGLRLRMADYAMENGYDLMAVVWYSSSTLWYTKSDTLRYFIDKHQPDYILICLGGNEQFARDLDKRAGYVRTMVERIGDIPFVWIGIPSWRSNCKFNDCVRGVVGDKRFYDSSRLTLARCEDHAHPTPAAASQWMDSVAVWLSGQETAHPIRMNVPTEKRKRIYKTIMLKPNCP